jgi:dTDP-4-amino-4,6-dideoxygalactose transaminase
MNALNAIASQHGLLVVEDCAQSFGARFGNRLTGTLSAAGCFSFYPSKNLGCFGDGGLIATNSDTTAQRIASLRNHGSDKRYHHSVIGYNSRLDEIQAAILRQKLKHIDMANEQRRAVAQRYDELLSDLPLSTPRRAKNSSHVFHQYTVLTDQRERIMRQLRAKEIACAIYYPIPLHQQEVFAGEIPNRSLPVSEDVSQRCLSLPMYPEMTQTEISSVADAIREAVG